MRRLTLISLVTLGLTMPACGDDAVTPDGGGGGATTDGGGSSSDGGGGAASGGAGGAGGAGSQLDWQPCPLFTGGPGTAAECVVVPAPLRWDEPAGIAIDLAVKRVPAAEQPARGQLWLLAGGPGSSVTGLESLTEYLGNAHPDLDIYMPEHRGVGGSTRLACPEQETSDSDLGVYISDAEVPACFAALEATWGDGLAAFSTSNAARDLGFLIDATRAPDQEAIVFGLSYGTMWAHRYLQIFPDQPTAIALDSICAPNCDFAQVDDWMNELGERVMTACGADTACSAKLGADPSATLTQALDGLEQGSCPEVAALGFDRNLLQRLFAQTMYSFGDRMLVPALAYRLQRCSAADINAFAHLAGVIFAPPDASEPPPDSPLLGMNIGLSELWPDPAPSLAEAQQALSGMNVALRVTERYARNDDYWPLYPLDEYAGKLASSNVPMLMLQGQDDFIPSTWVAPVQAAFDGPGQTFVSLPRSTHGSLINSPFGPTGFPCGLTLFDGFVADPSAPLDTSCAAEVAPYFFTLAPQVSGALLGTPDAWEGDPGPALSPQPLPAPPGENAERGTELVRLRAQYLPVRFWPPHSTRTP